ncbi:PTS sugar transporter subunit IIC [Bacillus carboniphilus]|uniref:PTS sugar transporter subunit IIC n=1 Tax=Bacillus carboniphilus TaxID=86663 RepID=A0ABN0WCI2_9BACI
MLLSQLIERKVGECLKSYLEKKGIHVSVKTYLIDALSFMALGLFSSLIIGLIIKTVGEQIANIPGFVSISEFFIELGSFAMDPKIMGAAIGVAIAYGLNAPPLVIFAAAATGGFGAVLGGPAGSYIAALFTSEFGKLVSKTTKVDIIVTPFVALVAGFLTAKFVGPGISNFMKFFGSQIEAATELRPIFMGIVVAVLMGLALTAPISSAAIAFMLDLSGVAAGAATIGCSAQMIGFAVMSYKENKVGGLFAQGLGTSMLQVPNIIRNPRILIPPTIAGALLAPLGTTLFIMENNAAGAGMGTSGLVGQIMTFTTMGFSLSVFWKVLFLHIIGPAVLTLVLSVWMRKKGWIRPNDLYINIGGERNEKTASAGRAS